MKSQAFADQSKFEFMKSKRMFEINPRHPMIVELNSRVKDEKANDDTKDMVMSLYMSAVVSAGYQLMPEDAQDFGERVGRMITSGLGIEADAELAPELEVAAEEETEEETEEEAVEVSVEVSVAPVAAPSAPAAAAPSAAPAQTVSKLGDDYHAGSAVPFSSFANPDAPRGALGSSFIPPSKRPNHD